jgi:LysR family transcriptional activator of nhaA
MPGKFIVSTLSFIKSERFPGPAMRDLNYNHLRYFWAIAHAGGLTRAAARLALSQSALSAQLAKLEARLGHRLFDRVGRRLVLTEAGRIALDAADTVFAAGAELLGTLQGRPTARRGVLRVGALTTLSRNFQIEVLKPLAARDDVALVLRAGTMRELLAGLDAHTLDVVLANSAPRRDARQAFETRLLDRQPVSLVARRAPRRVPRFRWPEDVRGLPLLLPSLESDIRAGFDRILEQAGIRPTVLAEVDDMAMLRLLARESRAAALVPPIVVRDELRSGVLVELARVPDLAEDFHAIVPKRRFPNPLLAVLLEGRPQGRARA